MKTILFLALRYFKGSKKNSATYFTAIISIASVGLSIATIFVTLSIINGFQSEIKQKIIDFHPNIIIYGEINNKDYENIKKVFNSLNDIEHYAPFIISQAIIISPTRTTGCIIKAIDPYLELSVTNISKALKYGKWQESGSAVIGQELARTLGIWIGDDIVAVIPKTDILSGIVPKMKKFKISGIINTGYFEYDSSFISINISDATNLIDGNIKANGISIKIKDIKKANKIKEELKKRLPFYLTIKTYEEVNKTLFGALKLEKFVMSLVMSLVVIISTFTITSNIYMMMLVKKKEIGIMRALGISSSTIKKVFLTLGFYISILGSVLGFIFSLFIFFIIKKYKIVELPSDIYYITHVPIKIEPGDVIFIVILAAGLTLISSYYPAKKASEMDPIDTIRYT